MGHGRTPIWGLCRRMRFFSYAILFRHSAQCPKQETKRSLLEMPSWRFVLPTPRRTFFLSSSSSLPRLFASVSVNLCFFVCRPFTEHLIPTVANLPRFTRINLCWFVRLLNPRAVFTRASWYIYFFFADLSGPRGAGGKKHYCSIYEHEVHPLRPSSRI